MRFASALSTRPDTRGALQEALESVTSALGGRADLAFLFLTPHHADAAEMLAAQVRERLGGASLLGCSGAGVLAAGREVEDGPALALMAGTVPGGRATVFHVPGGETEEVAGGWAGRLGIDPAESPSFVLLPDPYTLDAMALLAELDEAFPGCPKVGGMASGGGEPGSHQLFADGNLHREGAVGVALTGSVGISPLVSQGCRPVGPRLVITKGERNVIRELAGKPALGVIREVLGGLEPRDRSLAASGLLIGRVVQEAKPEFHRGDFLIRGLVGADEASGAVAVGDLIRRGQTVQLQVRDGATADEDLKALLAQRGADTAAKPPAAALVFACNGRGSGMYGDADHDSRVLREAVPGLPLSGFFCNGEVGPVGDRTFLHGFTASVGFLVPR